MSYQLTENEDLILDLESGAFIPRGHRLWEDYEAWKTAGNTPRSVPRDFVKVIGEAVDWIQTWIDRTAQQNGYDNAVSCVSYLGSTVTQWRQDAEAIRSWRDAVWQAAHLWRASLNGQIPEPLPDISQVIQSLPQPSAYGWNVHGNGASSGTGEQS